MLLFYVANWEVTDWSIHVLQVDHSIVESFGGEGKGCITARVYPRMAIGGGAHLYAFNSGMEDVRISSLSAWSMKKAHINWSPMSFPYARKIDCGGTMRWAKDYRGISQGSLSSVICFSRESNGEDNNIYLDVFSTFLGIVTTMSTNDILLL